MQEKTFSYFLKKPKYWPRLLGFLIAWLIGQLPFFIQRQIAMVLGWIMLYLQNPRHRRIAEINLELCFPEIKEEKKQQIIKDNIFSMTQGIVEVTACWFSNLQSRSQATKIIGGEHLEEAVSKGKGVILLSFHMTTLEIGGCLLAKRYPISAMYKPNRSPLIEYMMCQGRKQHLNELIKQDNIRQMIKALKVNKIIWYAADQDYGANKTSVYAPFFNIPANTITATTKLAKLTGAKVIPLTQKRINNNKNYEITIHPALENFPGENELGDATRINRFIEEYLKEDPTDYIWTHKRFKTRPEGEKSFYPEKKKK